MSRVRVLSCLLTLLVFTSPAAQERIVLNAPVFTQLGVTEFRVEGLYLKRSHPDAAAEIRAVFREVSGGAFVPQGKSLICRYDDADAEALIIGLNKANLSTNSLERRILAKCQQDGKLGAGTITGTPQ